MFLNKNSTLIHTQDHSCFIPMTSSEFQDVLLAYKICSFFVFNTLHAIFNRFYYYIILVHNSVWGGGLLCVAIYTHRVSLILFTLYMCTV